MTTQTTYTLRNGVAIPKIGFGTWRVAPGAATEKAVLAALETGYRLIDTAQTYNNEYSVGQALAKSDVPRAEIFLTTKLWNTTQTYDIAKAQIEISMQYLGVDYLDLMLIHWPNPANLRKNDAWKQRNAEVWRALEDAYQAGKLKAIGVSNFYQHHLAALLETATIKPFVNQVKIAPGLPQTELVTYCQDQDILVEAYSPLGSGDIFRDATLAEIAAKYNRSVAQVALRWIMDRGILPLPKSETPANIQSNFQVFDFELDAEDISRINQLTGITDPIDPDQPGF